MKKATLEDMKTNGVHSIAKGARACPFCADSRILIAYLHFFDTPTDKPYRGACGGCKTIGPGAPTPEEALRLWNSRAE